MTDQICSEAECTSWYLYLVETAAGQLYCGITLDVNRRFQEHCSNGRRTARFLRAVTHGDALRAEIQVKKLSRAQKLRLISGDRALFLRLSLSPVTELMITS